MMNKSWPTVPATVFCAYILVVTYGCSLATSGNNGVGDTNGTGDGPDSDAGILDVSVCDPSAGPFSLEIDNQYFPLPVGQVSVLEGDEDGESIRLEITVLDETEVVAGVTTRVLEEREFEDGELIEVSRNFYAQAPDGTVCYFGEDVQDFEDGEVVGSAGQWRAGVGDNRPGIIMPANPAAGQVYSQEFAPGVAEDMAEVVGFDAGVTVPAGTYENVLRTIDTSPLDPGEEDVKLYAPGIGIVVDDVVELISISP